MSDERLTAIETALQSRVRERGPVRMGILFTQHDQHRMMSLGSMVRDGWLFPILVGSADNIETTVKGATLEEGSYEAVEADTLEEQTAAALDLADKAKLDALGFSPHVAEEAVPLLQAAGGDLFPEHQPLMGLAAVALPEFPRLLFVGDVAVKQAPTVEEKAWIAEQAAVTVQALSVDEPRVAFLAAVEATNPGMPVTVEAEEAASKAQVQGAHMHGPLSMDVAINRTAAEKKKVPGEVPGRADILVGPTLTISRGVYQAMALLCGGRAGVTLLGGKLPVAIPGRADGDAGVLLSTMITAALA
ncbi:hypothetical protein GF324_12290 [bacterium]|nr:hypothetical protein [bacterium]